MCTDEELRFRRLPTGEIEPITSSVYGARKPCATHSEYDSGLDGRCVHCYQKIAPRTIMVKELNGDLNFYKVPD